MTTYFNHRPPSSATGIALPETAILSCRDDRALSSLRSLSEFARSPELVEEFATETPHAELARTPRRGARWLAKIFQRWRAVASEGAPTC